MAFFYITMNNKFRKSIIIPIIGLLSVSAVAKPMPYKNPGLDVSERVEDLLSRMTLHEKVLQLQNRQIGESSNFGSNFGGYSIGTVHDMDHDAFRCRQLVDSLNSYTDATCLSIPALVCVEGIQGILQDSCTIFPHALAQGSSFNPELIRRMTAACAEEARALGIRQVLSPVLDIARELRWGRIEETFGEDPYLISEMAIAFVDGYQDNGVGCMPKHFVAHGTPTGGLNCANVSGGWRELNNLYLYPFKKVIERTSPVAIMSCYSAYDGLPVSGSRKFMTDILRGQLGFKGFVYSDWGSVDRLKTFHHCVETSEQAAAKSLNAGIDIDVDDAYRTLEKQVEDGIVPMEEIDCAVRRVLKAKFELGLFDKSIGAFPLSDIHSAEHIALAKEVADESLILMENNGLLPLDAAKLSSIAVVGPNADFPVMGDYSWARPDSKAGVSFLDALRKSLPSSVKVNYAEGCDWWSRDDTDIANAVEAAAQSDVVVAVVGTRSTFLGRGPKNSTAGEAFDLSSLELPGCQQQLLEAVKATGKPLVVVLLSGKPLAMPWVKENADSFLVQWYGGECQGEALADVILGKVNPSGHLNVSFPRSTGNTPCYYNYYVTDREYGNDHGGSPEHPALHYVFEKPYALWPFGHGMSYTDFEYSDFAVELAADSIVATVTVTNTGGYEGKDVAQLYISDPVSSVLTPVKQLKAFSKFGLNPGESRQITMSVPLSELEFMNDANERVLEKGEFIVRIGTSSDDIKYSESIYLL